MKRMYNETFLWLFNDNNNFEYTAGYKVKHNNFVSCEHLSTHNSKAEKSILHLVTAPETAAVIQKVTKHDNITQKNETDRFPVLDGCVRLKVLT